MASAISCETQLDTQEFRLQYSRDFVVTREHVVKARESLHTTIRYVDRIRDTGSNLTRDDFIHMRPSN